MDSREPTTFVIPRPPKRTVRKTIMFDKDLTARIREVAKAQKASFSTTVYHLVQRGLDRRSA